MMLCICCSAFAFVNAQSAKAQTVKIGIVIGSADPATTSLVRSAKMAMDEINSAGGVLGKRLQLVPAFNPRRNYDTVPALTNSLIQQGVAAIISCGGSSSTMKTAETAAPKGVLVITPSSTSPKISTVKDNDLVWRTIPHDVFQGRIAARMLDSMKYRTASVIHPANVYGSELAKTFRETFQQRGGKVLNVVAYKEVLSKQYDFATYLDKVFDGKPSAIYVVGSEETAKFLAQSVEAKKINDSYKPFLFGCDGIYNDDFLSGVDATVIEGMTGLAYIHPQNDPAFDRFIAEFQKRAAFDDSTTVANSSLASLMSMDATNSYAATMYDAIYTLALAMVKANSTMGRDVAKQMREVANAKRGAEIIRGTEFARAVKLIGEKKPINYEGVSGAIEFDRNGDVSSGTYVVWRVEGGKFVQRGIVAFP